MEIDGKIDAVIEQLHICNRGQEDILSSINRIETRLDLLEERVSDSHSATSKCFQESKTLIIEEVSYLKACLRLLDDEVGRLSENNTEEFTTKTQSIIDEINSVKSEFLKSQDESIVTFGESLSY